MKNIKNKKEIIFITISVVLIIIAFFVGKNFGTKSNDSFMNSGRGQFSQNRGEMQNGQNRAQFSAGNVRGVVDSITDNSLVIKNQDGSSKIVILSASTTISKSAMATTKDVVSGENVIVRGKSNSDGSLTAESIQIFNGQDFSYPGKRSNN